MDRRPHAPVKWHTRPLGQSGYRIDLGGVVVYLDPYLTERVADLEGHALRRLTPAPLRPSDVTDADWVLVSHEHLDHCDPTTVLPILAASPRCKVIATAPALRILMDAGAPADRLVAARESWMPLGRGVEAHAVPAAHTRIERDAAGGLRFAGYVLRHDDRHLYFAGDTSPHPEITRAVRALGPVDVALLPVNERNVYRDAAGIVGNMSVREAFRFAQDLGAKTVVPMHYDTFAPNSVYPEEIRLLYDLTKPPFALLMKPEAV